MARVRCFLLVLTLMTAGCSMAPIDESDATSPTVTISVRQSDGTYEEATTGDLAFRGTVSLVVVVKDPDGVRSLSVDFAGRFSKNCVVDGQPHEGNFPVEPFPEAVEQDLGGNEDGEVPQTLPMVVEIDDISCKLLTGEEGRPVGHAITVRATGRNWSSEPAHRTARRELRVLFLS